MKSYSDKMIREKWQSYNIGSKPMFIEGCEIVRKHYESQPLFTVDNLEEKAETDEPNEVKIGPYTIQCSDKITASKLYFQDFIIGVYRTYFDAHAAMIAHYNRLLESLGVKAVVWGD